MLSMIVVPKYLQNLSSWCSEAKSERSVNVNLYVFAYFLIYPRCKKKQKTFRSLRRTIARYLISHILYIIQTVHFYFHFQL